MAAAMAVQRRPAAASHAIGKQRGHAIGKQRAMLLESNRAMLLERQREDSWGLHSSVLTELPRCPFVK